jgi:hypothetical protein
MSPCPPVTRGSNLIAYADSSSNVKEFVARPIQMKASSEASFSIDRKNKRVKNLILAHVWYVHDANATVTLCPRIQGCITNSEPVLGESKGKLRIVETRSILHEQAKSYADDPTLVRKILFHEIPHALVGPCEDDQHGEKFRVKLRAIDGSLFDATGVRS